MFAYDVSRDGFIWLDEPSLNLPKPGYQSYESMDDCAKALVHALQSPEPTMGQLFHAYAEAQQATIVTDVPIDMDVQHYLPQPVQTEEVRRLLLELEMAKLLEKLELSPKAPLKSLSKGNKEKVQLILAMSRNARLYLLDEPIGGVDPAARDYILNTILTNYSRDASVIISTHLIEDVEPVLDEAVFLKNGRIFAHRSVDELRETEGMSVDAYFREVFKC